MQSSHSILLLSGSSSLCLVVMSTWWNGNRRAELIMYLVDVKPLPF